MSATKIKKDPNRYWPNWECANCGTNVTPERRSGPQGRASLCNSCGIKYYRPLHEDKRRIRKVMSIGFILNDI